MARASSCVRPNQTQVIGYRRLVRAHVHHRRPPSTAAPLQERTIRMEETPMHNPATTDAPMSPARMQVRFGPRTVLVERFLMRLSKLPVATWVGSAAIYQGLVRGEVSHYGLDGTLLDGDAWASADVALCGAMAERESARVRVTRRVLHITSATKGIVPKHSYDAMLQAALTAVFAIICRDEIGPEAFRLLYAPFATAIPIEELEEPAA